MKRRERERWLVHIDKNLAKEFRNTVVNYKGDLSRNVEEAIRLYLATLRGGTHTSNPPMSKNVHTTMNNDAHLMTPPTEQSNLNGISEVQQIVEELAAICSIGGVVGKPVLEDIIVRRLGLTDKRAIRARIDKLRALGIIKPHDTQPGLYIVQSLEVDDREADGPQ